VTRSVPITGACFPPNSDPQQWPSFRQAFEYVLGFFPQTQPVANILGNVEEFQSQPVGLGFWVIINKTAILQGFEDPEHAAAIDIELFCEYGRGIGLILTGCHRIDDIQCNIQNFDDVAIIFGHVCYSVLLYKQMFYCKKIIACQFEKSTGILSFKHLPPLSGSGSYAIK
jgi:hypothetical protein